MNLKRTLETASPTTTVRSSESEMPLGSITGTFKLQFRQPLSNHVHLKQLRSRRYKEDRERSPNGIHRHNEKLWIP